MGLHTRKTYDSFKVVCGVLLFLNLHYGFVFSEDNPTGQPLSIVALLEPPYVMKDPATGKFIGFMIDVLHKAGITIDHLETPVEDTYGWEENAEDLTGIVGGLVSGKYDLAVAPFSIRSKSAKYITFTQPVLHHGYRSLYKLPKDKKWLDYRNMDAAVTLLKPFSPGLWFLIILMCVLASVTLYIIRRYSPYENDVIAPGSQVSGHSLATMSWGNSFMYLLGSLAGRDISVTPRSTSGRILTAVWWFFSLMTVGAYIAGLVVTLFKTSPHVGKLPFATAEELISASDVKFLGVKNSSTYHYIADHKGHFETMVHNYWRNNWDTTMMDTFEEAMKLVNKGDGKYALLMSEDRAQYLASMEPCDKMVIGDPVGDKTIGFACPKGSAVCENISHVILELQEQGKIEKFRNDYFLGGCSKNTQIEYHGNSFLDTFGGDDSDLLSPKNITIHRFSGAFILLVIGFLIAMLVLVAEICYSRRKGNNHRHLKTMARDEDARTFHDDDFVDDPADV